jgi:hypothetical protein
MKKILMAAAAASFGIATPALADGDNTGLDTEVFTINAENPPKCNLEAANYVATITGDNLTDSEGRARTDVGATVADALSALNLTAWCTGASNKLNVYRTALTTGDGTQTTGEYGGGFNRALVYDVRLAIPDARRLDGQPIYVDGTSDGQGNGAGLGNGAAAAVGRFGPSGQGSALYFGQDDSNTSFAASNNAGTAGRDAYTASTNRLVAGSYQSTLTIELTPGF